MGNFFFGHECMGNVTVREGKCSNQLQLEVMTDQNMAQPKGSVAGLTRATSELIPDQKIDGPILLLVWTVKTNLKIGLNTF